MGSGWGGLGVNQEANKICSWNELLFSASRAQVRDKCFPHLQVLYKYLKQIFCYIRFDFALVYKYWDRAHGL